MYRECEEMLSSAFRSCSLRLIFTLRQNTLLLLCENATLIEVLDLITQRESGTTKFTPETTMSFTYPALCTILFVKCFRARTDIPFISGFDNVGRVQASEVRIPAVPAPLSVLS